MSRRWISLNPKNSSVKSYTPSGTLIDESKILSETDRHLIDLLIGSSLKITTAEDEEISSGNTRYTKIVINDDKKLILCHSTFKRIGEVYMKKIHIFEY